jgi:hypothetical protein
MTIAVDRINGEVLGQVVEGGAYYVGAYGRPIGTVRLLTATGYVTVPADSVRVEEVR